MTTDYDLRIDGDVIVYVAGYAADSRGGDLSHSLFNAKLIIEKIKRKFPGTCTVYLSSTHKFDNFRNTIVSNYKANRSKTVKPVYYDEIRKYLLGKFKARLCRWGEADDWIGLNPTDRTVIASVDKDLLMIPNVVHYRMTNEKVVRSSDPGKLFLAPNKRSLLGVGFAWFCAQMIMGDKVDNIIPPVPGFGPVTTLELFKGKTTAKEFWGVVLNHYKEHAHDDALLTNGQLLWISRKEKQRFSLELVEEIINEQH